MSLLRPHHSLPLLLPRHTRFFLHAFHSTSPNLSSSPNTDSAASTPRPNAPVALDPALQALLKDADASLWNMRQGEDKDVVGRALAKAPKELEVLHAIESEIVEDADADADADVDDDMFPRNERKSPAASFGSRGIGAVVLPFELQRSILKLISESDKPLIHADASRLFQSQDPNANAAEDAWSLHYTSPAYTIPKSASKISHIKARLNRARDGTAFASVVMPAQYAVIRAVLHQLKMRLGMPWAHSVDRVVEWGSGTGAGMWAMMHTFQRPTEEENNAGEGIMTLARSRIVSYTGIDKRDGLTSIARRLLTDVSHPSISLQKSLHTSDRVPRLDGLGTIALSAFNLSTLGNAGLRRQMVKEMWESGADILVIIDEASTEGFQHVTDAREQLLKLGRREVEAVARDQLAADGEPGQGPADLDDGRGKRGSHVIAPCPHDQACPLAFHLMAGASKARSPAAQSSAQSVRCTFSQRLQRPAFVRRTKHATKGEEDVGYAYVIIRRGERPAVMVKDVAKGGRVGAVGRWEDEAKAEKEETRRVRRWDADGADVVEPVHEDAVIKGGGELTGEALEDVLRAEAYGWPRINFPPLKRSGHVLIDACMPEGNVMRLTFPRSQGKQIYYDARKSGWGDLFPHTSKHRPVPRYTGPKAKVKPASPPQDTIKIQEEEDGDEDPVLEGVLDRALAPEKKQETKNRGRGRGGEGALQKVGAKGESRAGWAGVMGGLKEEEKRRRRERRRERGTKEAGGDGM